MRIFLLFLLIMSGCDIKKPTPIISSLIPTTSTNNFLPKKKYEVLLIEREPAIIKEETRKDLCQEVIPDQITLFDEVVLDNIKGLSINKTACFNALAQDLQENLAGLIDGAFFEILEAENVHSYAYDVAVIGAGAAASVFSRNFLQTNPAAKVIIVDKEEQYLSSHFATDIYRINSPEAVGPLPPASSTNIFPGAPVQVSDLGYEQRFVPARALWDMIIMSQFFSNVDVAMKQEIRAIKKINLNNVDLYQVKLAKKGNIFAKKIVIASGLGVPSALPISPEMAKTLEEEKKRCLSQKCIPPVMTIDDLIAFDRIFKEKNWNIFDELEQKDIAVVGAHDGGMIAMEFLSEQAPPDAYISYKAPNKISWFNQKITSYSAFSADWSIKPRYRLFPLVQKFYKALFDDLLYVTNNGVISYENSFLKLDSCSLEDGKVVLFKSNGDKLIVDYVISAIGYKNNVKLILQAMMSEDDKNLPLSILCPRVSAHGNTAALKCNLAQEKQEIYLIGTAAEALPTQTDIDNSTTKNAHSFNVLNLISETFAKEYLNL